MYVYLHIVYLTILHLHFIKILFPSINAWTIVNKTHYFRYRTIRPSVNKYAEVGSVPGAPMLKIMYNWLFGIWINKQSNEWMNQRMNALLKSSIVDHVQSILLQKKRSIRRDFHLARSFPQGRSLFFMRLMFKSAFLVNMFSQFEKTRKLWIITIWYNNENPSYNLN